MPRLYLVLAALDAALLLAAALLGAAIGGDAARQGPHVRVGLVAVIATPALHCLAWAYFLGTGRWIEGATGDVAALSWAGDLADRNGRRVTPFLLVSTLLVGAAAWLGLGVRSGHVGGLLHLAAAVVALAFTLGTFALSYLAIVNQTRLIDAIDARRPEPATEPEPEPAPGPRP
jgi:hypothetical protein